MTARPLTYPYAPMLSHDVLNLLTDAAAGRIPTLSHREAEEARRRLTADAIHCTWAITPEGAARA